VIEGLYSRHWRGFRIVHLIGWMLVVVLAVVVYLGKTFAGDERTRIAEVEQQIDRERARVRVLRAEVAYLEQPERLERLAREYLGMEPIGAAHEAPVSDLPKIAGETEEP